MRSKFNRGTLINVCIIAFLILTVVIPIVTMLIRITPEGFQSVIESKQFGSAVFNSITTALTATVISITLALTAAFCLERASIKLKAVISLIFVLPMLIPSISHAFGLVALFGTNGLITNLFGLNWVVYGFTGIVLGSVMYSFPVAFLMFSSILQYEDGSAYRAAEVLGIPPFRRFISITLPYLKRTIISAFFAVFTMIITDYGVPLMIGGKTTTLSVLMYNKAVSMVDYDTGSVIGAFLLIPAFIAFFVDLLHRDEAHSGFVTESVKQKDDALSKTLAYIFCTVLAICIIAPLVAFIFMTFETKYPVNPEFTLYHVQKTMNSGAGRYLVNSLIYSFLTAFFGTFIAFVASYATARSKALFHSALHLIALTSMAIPGIVLGLSYVIFFHDKGLYGTIFIVVLANSIHFFSSPYLMMYNTLRKVNPYLESVGASLGVNKIRIIRDVILVKVKYTLFEMFTYFFVNSMMTISAVAFLAPPAPKAVSLMINQFEAQRLMESAAFVSILILLINLTIKTVVAILRRREKHTDNAVKES